MIDASYPVHSTAICPRVVGLKAAGASCWWFMNLSIHEKTCASYRRTATTTLSADSWNHTERGLQNETKWYCAYRLAKITRLFDRPIALSFIVALRSLVCLSRPHCTHTSQSTQNFFGVSEFRGSESKQASKQCALALRLFGLVFAFAIAIAFASPFRLINAISAWMERWFLFYLSLTGLGSVLIARPLESAFAAAAADKSIERKLNWASLIYLFILFSISTHTTHTHQLCAMIIYFQFKSVHKMCMYVCVLNMRCLYMSMLIKCSIRVPAPVCVYVCA